jgi:hypothetical protein
VRSGFSFIKNGERLGYPYKEALLSISPLVDELVVAHGDSEDGTGAALEALRPKLACPLRIVVSPWDARNIKGGLELSRQTNIALEACAHESCLYIQGDEVLHEDDYPIFRADLERFEREDDIDALAFAWVHFYGNFETYVESRAWYRREIRAVKKSRGLRSYSDAQGFRIEKEKGAWKKPRAALSRARYLHYGWVRPPETMARKSESFDRLWHGNARDGIHKAENVYPPHFGMKRFQGTHPRVMHERVEALRGFDPFEGQKPKQNLRYWKLWSSWQWEAATGCRIGEFKNFSSLRTY